MYQDEVLELIEGVEYSVTVPELSSFPETKHYFKRSSGEMYYKDARYYIGWIELAKLPENYLVYLKDVVLGSIEARYIPLVFSLYISQILITHSQHP